MKKIIGLLLLLATHQLLMAQNIGIGTTTPAFKLDVNGRMRVKTGTLNNISTSSGIWMEDYRDGTNRAFFGMQDSIRIGFYGAGTGGTGWGFNFNTVTGNVGIGITNALSALHVHSPDNTFNSYLRLTHQTSGTSFSDGAYMGLDGNNLLFRNSENGMILFSNSGGDRLLINSAGNVGIGTGLAIPQAKLHIDGGNSVGGFNGGYLQLGSVFGSNLALDNQQIQARSASGPSQLFLQNNGGGTSIGSGTGILVLPASGEINKPFVTGNSNLLPLAYGRVAENGAIVGSTGNFTVQKAETGKYIITLTGETNVYLNRNNYMIQVTPYIGYNDQFGILLSKAYFAGATIINDNTIIIQMAEPNVPYTNGSCANQCGPFSLVTGNKFFDEVDVGFSILIYKY
jgi:hypothetical protein